MKRFIVLVLCLLALVLAKKHHQAGLYLKDEGQGVEGSWMVVFFPNTDEGLRENHMHRLAKILGEDESIGNKWNVDEQFLGYHGKFDFNTTVQYIRSDPIVKYVEEDGIVSIAQSCNTQSGAVWNLPRVSGTTGSFVYNSAGGSGTVSYVIDTGILLTHVDFGGRAIAGQNFIAGETIADCNGHGTHVAGTIGGTTYGIAKQTQLVAVKVLGCSGSGTNTGVNNGINWAANNGTGKRCVLNLSLGGGFSQAQNDIMNAASNKCFGAVAAGNSNTNLQTTSPASAACNGGPTWAIGSTDSNNAKSSFSNYGSCLSVWAPGTSITSDWYTSNTATNTISGTSMASPAVAGAAALLWSGANAGWSLATLRSNLSSRRVSNMISLVPSGTPNVFIRVTCP